MGAGLRGEYPQQGKLVENKGISSDGEGKLDLSLYKGPEQLMCCMGCCKDERKGEGRKPDGRESAEGE